MCLLRAQRTRNKPCIRSIDFIAHSLDAFTLGPEDPLEEEMATHSRILAWEIPWTEEPGRLQSMGWQESDTTW